MPSIRPAPPSVNGPQSRKSSSLTPRVSQRHVIHIGDTPPHDHFSSPEQTDDAVVDSETAFFTGNETHPSPSFPVPPGVVDPSHSHGEPGSAQQGSDMSRPDSLPGRFYNTSQQISVTTALAWLGVSGISEQPFSYFIDEVDFPAISPFDSSNWKRMKVHIVQLAVENQAIAAATLAVQSVYRAQVNRLPMFHATSEFAAALATFEQMIEKDTIDFDDVLVEALLLCLCQVTLPNEDGPSFRGFNPPFEARLGVWLLNSQRSPVSLRIGAWLQLLHVATKRSGCSGLLPETAFALLSTHITEVPNLPSSGECTDSASSMYDIISAPIFTFYLKLQRVSNEIQDLSHYRRSRVTPEDQAEVAGLVVGLNNTLSALWDSRPGPLRFQPNELRQNFRQAIAEPLVSFAGVCIAAYFGEVVGLRRTLGDDPFPSEESQQAMRQIRILVERKWNASEEAL